MFIKSLSYKSDEKEHRIFLLRVEPLFMSDKLTLSPRFYSWSQSYTTTNKSIYECILASI